MAILVSQLLPRVRELLLALLLLTPVAALLVVAALLLLRVPILRVLLCGAVLVLLLVAALPLAHEDGSLGIIAVQAHLVRVGLRVRVRVRA